MANQNVTVMALSAASASVNGADFDALNTNGIVVMINISAITGTTPTATFTLQGKDPQSGNYYTILASTALNATGLTILRVFPAATAAANAVANDITPPIMRVICTIGGTTPAVTATVNVALIKN